ncbi:hypothetical protein [Streptomyces sp. NRRL S-920]|uniref:hypothetical protein n=1 Tax=Streptomyces sp. NRRL S-920 TaxID=1463921 RepID=UPI00055E0F81|nr:hypothetical protein [Streptomyces sp. NRRL S-920]
MDIRGYETGPIAAEAAFTSDFEIPGDLPVQKLVDMLEIERRSMDIRPGMRHKYTPLRFDSAAGTPQIGGRYLFDTWDNVLDYDDFTSNELEFEEGVKFWDRPFFLDVDRHIWRVTGAHDFTPLATTHHVNRFERWTYDGDAANAARLLEQSWPALRDHAGAAGAASVWLLHQPDEKQIGVLTVAARTAADTPGEAAARSLDALARTPSPGRLLPDALGAVQVFDRTSLILAMWLPESRVLGGAPSAYPSAPVHPLPTVPPQEPRVHQDARHM